MSWNITEKDKYTVFLPNFNSEIELTNAIYNLQIKGNKIIDCSSIVLNDSVISLLAKAYKDHSELQISFLVIISAKEDMDSLEDYFVVVLTLSEAIEYIYMEELERNV